MRRHLDAPPGLAITGVSRAEAEEALASAKADLSERLGARHLAELEAERARSAGQLA